MDSCEVTIRYSKYTELTRISIEFVLDFTKAELDVDVFVGITLGMRVHGNMGECLLKLNKSLYGLNQASANWFDPLKIGIERRVYHQSQVDRCVFYRRYSVFLTYVDDCVIVLYKHDAIK